VYVRDTLSVGKHDVLRPLSRGRRPNSAWVRRRLRALAAFARHLPATLRSRRRQHVGSSARRMIVEGWMVPR
jgi:hypothetical protein